MVLFKSNGKGKNVKKEKKKDKKGRSGSLSQPPVLIQEFKPEYTVIDEYRVQEPFAKVYIVMAPELGVGYHYFVDEVKLSDAEREAHEKLVSIISHELQAPETLDVDAAQYVLEEAKRLTLRYRRSVAKKLTKESLEKVYYYVIRDLAGYGELNALMLDPNIEDISCNGVNKPVYVWHRKYESIPTNIRFIDEYYYDNFILKLAHISGKHISSAQPILDASLPEKHRLACTFMHEVSTHGSTFCIRKFQPDPFSIIDLINLGTLDAKMAAYLWLILENKMNLMIIGGTGAGKTSTLNALTSLISPNDKLVTVEEVAELNPPHENWVQLVSRRGFKFGAADTTSISLFDLMKLSLRYRPDYIIVGEVRGEEAYVLFQAIATGHGGICTMHADSLDHAVKRLTSPPMNVAEVYIPLMNVCLYIARVDLPNGAGGPRFGRRIRNTWEVADFGKYNQISVWLPTEDNFQTDLTKSMLLERIAEKRGVTKEGLLMEIDRRERLLKTMAERNIRDQREVAQIIMRYYYQCRGIGIPNLEAITLQSPNTLEASFAQLMQSLNMLNYAIDNAEAKAEAEIETPAAAADDPEEGDKK
ncbi:MAG: type II/IV secretion system ATPase subunit [Candidatus Bathyarchaeia archaeon]